MLSLTKFYVWVLLDVKNTKSIQRDGSFICHCKGIGRTTGEQEHASIVGEDGQPKTDFGERQNKKAKLADF